MRNPYEYPVTTDEIVALLERYLIAHDNEAQNPDGPIGSMTGEVLEEAIRRIRSFPNWCVKRQDDSGNVFTVRDGLSEKDATRLKELLEARGHKQTYSAQKSEA